MQPHVATPTAVKYDLQLLKLCLYRSVFWHWNNGAFSKKARALKTIPENLLLGPLWSHWMGVWSESREGDLLCKKDTEKQACKGHRVTMWAYLLICHPSFLPALLCECLIWMVMLWDKGKSFSISCEHWAHFGCWIINAFGGKTRKSFREREIIQDLVCCLVLWWGSLFPVLEHRTRGCSQCSLQMQWKLFATVSSALDVPVCLLSIWFPPILLHSLEISLPAVFPDHSHDYSALGNTCLSCCSIWRAKQNQKHNCKYIILATGGLIFCSSTQ